MELVLIYTYIHLTIQTRASSTVVDKYLFIIVIIWFGLNCGGGGRQVVLMTILLIRKWKVFSNLLSDV